MVRTHSTKPKDVAAKRRASHHARFRKIMLLSAVAVTFAVKTVVSRYVKTPKNDSNQSGANWLTALLHGHPDRFREVYGLNRHVFRRLLSDLQRKAGLEDSKYICADEQLAIFLYICTSGLSIRKAAVCLQRSIDTISKYVYSCINVLWVFHLN